MYLYFGSDTFSLEVLKGLHGICPPLAVVTQPDRPAGRNQQLRPGPLALFAQEQGLPLVQPETLKTAESQDSVLAFGAQLMIVVSFGQILPSSFLARSPTIINGHASLLPAYRGASPIQTCLLDGESESGMTIMHIVKALDAGAMISIEKVAIDSDETHGSLSQKLIEAGVRLLSPFIQGETVPAGEEQDHSRATYCHKLDKTHCTLLPHEQNSTTLDRTIRAFSPSPGAFVRIETPKGVKQLKILEAAFTEDSNYHPAGIFRKDKSIVLVGKDGVSLCCAEVQLEGKPALKASEFLNGFRGELQLA
jgi:methionyl-tRNA formyltransferase